MASVGDENLGTRREFELRDDDRASPYTGSRRRSGYGLVLLLGIVVAGAFVAYGMFHRGEVSSGAKPEATVGATR